jgi:hypothetical protein
MTKLLERAFKEASKLPEIEQNAFAKWVMEEIESERKWEKTFAGSEDVLDKLADEALAAYKHGKTELMSFEQQ